MGVCVSVSVCRCAYATATMKKLKDNFLELILSFYHVGSKDRTRVVRFV